MCIICPQRADTSVCKRRRDSDGSRDGQPFLRDKYYLLHFDFHGKHVDLCPPLVNSTQQFSPIVSSVVTLGGMAFAIAIFIGGF